MTKKRRSLLLTPNQRETMYQGITAIVRSNQNAVMFRYADLVGDRHFYVIHDLKKQENTYSGTLNAVKKAWNRHYANSRQFVTKNGMNHRYLGQ